MAMRKSLFIPSILLSVLAIMAPGQSTSTITELDPAIAVAVELNKKVRLDLYAGREKSEEIESGKGKIGVGVSFRVKPIFRRFLDAVDTDKQHLLVLAATY